MEKQEKPRGQCTGCAFEYQLGTARSGEFKGLDVIRKHNSRVGPGLCEGAQKPPREPETEDVSNAVELGQELGRHIAETATQEFADPAPVPEAAAPAADFADPAPMPAEMAPVSGQPEPDRDKWSRYLIHGAPHTRVTTFVKMGSSTFALGEWNERMLLKGLTQRPDLLAMAHGLDVKRDRARMNALVDDAQTHAGNKVKANIGTALHAFTEQLDAGVATLDDVPPQWRGRCVEYWSAIAEYGLTTRREWIERTTAVRADQVSAPLPVAGTMDRIFALPNGDLVIGDLKTGSDLSYGWAEIAAQLAVYAHGVNTHGLFDWNTKSWQPLERTVRTDYAIVMHLPSDGEGCHLYRVDLVKGWEFAQISGRVQARQKDKSVAAALTVLDVQAPPVAVGTSDLLPDTPELQVVPESAAHPVMTKAEEVISAAQTRAELAPVYEYAATSGRFTAYQLGVVKRWCAERWEQLPA